MRPAFLLLLLLVAPIQGAVLRVGMEPTNEAMPTTFDSPFDQIKWALDQAHVRQDEYAPVAVKNLLALQPPEPPQNQTQAQNQTQIVEEGRQTHHHGNLGQQGLNPVWATTFHGIPDFLETVDLDGNNQADFVVATDISVSAYSDAGELLWARHLGNRVTSLFVTDIQGDGKPDIGYSTAAGFQTPRVGILRGDTGAIVWEYIGTRSFLTAAPASINSQSDILAVDSAGNHMRLTAVDGTPLWNLPTGILADTGAVVAAHLNAGHYLAVVADMNGDGIKDMVSAALTLDYVLLVTTNIHTILYATDGSTGQPLWIHTVAPDPAYIHVNILLDMTAADIQGDGQADIAMAGFDFRMYYVFGVPATAWTYEAFLRAVDGSSNTVGVIVGQRSVASPIPLEIYEGVVAQDVDGDGRDELAVLTYSIVGALLSDAYSVQRFAIGPAAQPHPTMILLSDVAMPLPDAQMVRMRAVPNAAGSLDVGVTTFTGLAGTWQRLAPDGAISTPDVTTQDLVMAAADADGKTVLATARSLQLRNGNVTVFATPLRGTPIELQVADYDRDGHPDVWVASTDGQIHIVDGVTGAILVTHPYAAPFALESFRLADVDKDGHPNVILLRQSDYRSELAGYIPGSKTAIYATVLEGSPLQNLPWLDGNGDGVPDVVRRTYQHIILTSGQDGQELWAKMPSLANNRTYFYPGLAGTVSFDGADDVAFVDQYNRELVVMSGRDGATRFHETIPGTYGYPVCMGHADTHAEGHDRLQLVSYAYESGGVATSTTEYGPDGKVGSLSILSKNGRALGCSILASPGPGGDKILFAGSTFDSDVKGGFGLFDAQNGTWIWRNWGAIDEVEAQAYRVLAQDLEAPKGARVFMAYQDHVYGMYLANGTVFGTFSPNGPFIGASVLANLDGQGPSEIIALSEDGILWALTDQQKAVAENLATAAQKAGKSLPGSFAPSLPEEEREHLNAVATGGAGTATKGTPLPGMLVLVGLAVALWAARKRV